METVANSEQGELVGGARGGESAQEGAQRGGGGPSGEQGGGLLGWTGGEAGGKADCLEQRARGDPNGDRDLAGLVETGCREEGIGDYEVGVVLGEPVEQRGVRQRGVGQREGALVLGEGVDEHGGGASGARPQTAEGGGHWQMEPIAVVGRVEPSVWVGKAQLTPGAAVDDAHAVQALAELDPAFSQLRFVEEKILRRGVGEEQAIGLGIGEQVKALRREPLPSP